MATLHHRDSDEYQSTCRRFDKLWEDVQEYYIETHARGILVTAVTATSLILRKFRPTHIVIEEASQLTEFNTVPTRCAI